MTRLFFASLVFLLVVHGLIHLMGLWAYWPLGTLRELPYKTTLLNGRIDVGATGMRMVSLLWLAAAVGLVVAAVGLTMSAAWWQPLLIATALFSLVITVLDWQVAFRGALLDLFILAIIYLLPQLTALMAGRGLPGSQV